MAEWINRDEVLSMSYCTNKPTWDNPHLDPKSVVDVEDIESLPTADVVEVVRCKNCKYFDIEEDDALGTCMGKFICISSGGEIYPEPNHYCSYGERRFEE